MNTIPELQSPAFAEPIRYSTYGPKSHLRSQYEIHRILQSTTHYQVLDLDQAASYDEIRKSYLLKSKLVHPDKNGHEDAKEAFHMLSRAYEVLRIPKSRRIYDLSGGDIHSYAFGGTSDQSWKACVTEVFSEFMNANYEPVMTVLDLLHKQNPEISVNRRTVEQILHTAREVIVAGQVKWELVRPEMRELKQLQDQKISFFDVLGRTKYSLSMTRLVLQIIKKSFDSPPEGQDSTGRSGAAVYKRYNATSKELSEHRHTNSSPAGILTKYLSVVLYVIELGEIEVDRLMKSWLVSWFR